MKRAPNSNPASSRPMSLLPSAADCASSPSTISSGSGGTKPLRQIPALSPITSTDAGENWKDRHSSPQM
jgi:hypothetical protein